MTSLRKFALGALLTVSAFSAVTMTSCKKDDDKGCAVGYTGSDCKTPLITSLITNSYKGNGSDNKGGTYNNWSLSVAPTGTDLTKFSLSFKNADGVTQFAFPATLTSNTSFNLDGTTSGDYTYTGSGTISESATSMSVTVNQKDNTSGGDDLTITFSNMVKQ